MSDTRFAIVEWPIRVKGDKHGVIEPGKLSDMDMQYLDDKGARIITTGLDFVKANEIARNLNGYDA